jgi:hypothetical protein
MTLIDLCPVDAQPQALIAVIASAASANKNAAPKGAA